MCEDVGGWRVSGYVRMWEGGGEWVCEDVGGWRMSGYVRMWEGGG